MNRLTTVVFCTVAVMGCSKHPVAPNRTPDEPAPPDLAAHELFLFRSDVPIGDDPFSMKPAGGGLRELDELLIVDFKESPHVRLASAGDYPSVDVAFYVNDELWSTRTLSLHSTALSWRSVSGGTWAPPDTGVYTLRVVVDPDDAYEETDETNNQASLQVRVAFGDLVAGLVWFHEDRAGRLHRVHEVSAGTEVTVVAESFARGIYDDHRTRLLVAGADLIDRRATLRGGSLFPDIRHDTVTFVPPAAGTYMFEFSVDPDGEFDDRDRQNNVRSRNLVVVD